MTETEKNEVKSNLIQMHRNNMTHFGYEQDHSKIHRNVPVEKMTVSEFMGEK